MAERQTEDRTYRRARHRVQAALVVVLTSVMVAVAASSGTVGAVEAGTSSPLSAEPQAVTEYEPSTPAYAGAPWFRPGAPYDQNFPDPNIVWDGTRYWATATSTGGPTLPAMWSTDLETWTARDAYSPNTYNSDPYFNDAFPVPPSWSVGGATQQPGKAQWAPGMAKIGGSWVVYTSWEQSPGRRCISAARSSSPGGPFVDQSSTPLQCDVDAPGSIDASPFFDANGQPWLTWKAEGDAGIVSRIYSQPLSADGLHFKAGSSPSLLTFPVRAFEGRVVENPSMIYRDGAYWLLYSVNEWASSSYRMSQVRCDSPAGPCRFTTDGPLFGNTSSDLGPGGGALFVDASGRMRLAYHAWNAPYSRYPDDPNCDRSGECSSQGQRYLHLEGVEVWAGRLTVDPIGSLDVASSAAGRITVAGWALDPSDTASIPVHVYVDGVGVAVLADGARPDIASTFAGMGASHGFSTSVAVGPGNHQVCAYGIHTGPGENSLLGCRTVFVASGPPIGNIDVASGTVGGVAVAGWALDPDSSQAIAVHTYLDGRGVALTADGSRPDVGAAYPGFGSDHGFAAFLPAGPGSHELCAFAINVGAGDNVLLGCRTISVPGGPPIGNLDVAIGGTSSVAAAGWAIDPDTGLPIDVHVYVDGTGVAVPASSSRPDVGAFFPAYGADHGFSVTVPAGPGSHQVCAYGINVGAGYTSLLGCQQVVVADSSPFGSLDLVAVAPGAVDVAGWAIDPDLRNQAIDVHVYVDGAGVALRADQTRPDVAAAYPGAEAAHGFSARVSAPPGSHRVCAYGINVGAGGNSVLGCRDVVVP